MPLGQVQTRTPNGVGDVESAECGGLANLVAVAALAALAATTAAAVRVTAVATASVSSAEERAQGGVDLVGVGPEQPVWGAFDLDVLRVG